MVRLLVSVDLTTYMTDESLAVLYKKLLLNNQK